MKTIKTNILRFLLSSESKKNQPALPANYQYLLSAIIYRIIQNAYASLYDKGYGKGFKNFKLCAFSDIISLLNRQGDSQFDKQIKAN